MAKKGNKTTNEKITQTTTEKMSNSNKKSKIPEPRTRYRMFSIQLYCTPDRWQKVLDNADHYAWILHDKDTKEDGTPKKNHYHLLVEYANNRTWSAVLKEFNLEGLTEDTTINVQVGGNRRALADYLLHQTKQCHDDGKHEYSIGEVTTDSKVWWYEDKRYDKEKEHDNFIDDLLEGDYTHREMAYKYGRDYIKNAHHYTQFKQSVVYQERNNERKTFVKALHDSLESLADGESVIVDKDVADFLEHNCYMQALLAYRVKEKARKTHQDVYYVLNQALENLYIATYQMLKEDNEI